MGVKRGIVDLLIVLTVGGGMTLLLFSDQKNLGTWFVVIGICISFIRVGLYEILKGLGL